MQDRPEERPGALGCTPTDLDEVERIVNRSGTSFARGMRILPPDRRYAMFAIYAFCRLVDDVADDPAPLEDKLPRLADWRQRTLDLYQGIVGDNALDRVLLVAIRRFGLKCEDFLAVIDGMRSDAERVIVAPREAELDLYMDRVAAAVGRLSVRAFGDPSPAAERVAYHLGRAFQITNILRDLGEDAERGRLYLPDERLRDAGVPADPAAALVSPALPRVCRAMARMARLDFRLGFRAMRACDQEAMRPARLMALGYRAILASLEREAWREPARRISLPAWRKGLLAVAALKTRMLA